MASDYQPVPTSRPGWDPLPHPESVGVVGRVLLRRDDLVIAQLQFDISASIHKHAADIEVDVICLEGGGFVSVDGVETEFSAGQQIRWPAGLRHKLWTTDKRMQTLMVEHHR